ncbi:MAG: LamG domain-containing protein [Pirellulales bacterium]|nr:LamG domain-containing protein [Pirellulales bacterium]
MRGSRFLSAQREAGSFGSQWTSRPATPVFTPTQLSGVTLWLPSHLTDALWQENLVGTPLMRATTDGHTVGQIDDQGPDAHRATAGNAGREPLLGSGGGRASFLVFDGVNDFLTVENSRQAFAYVHTTAQFTLLAWVKVASDGTNLVLLDTARGGGTDKFGLYLGRNASGNTLTLLVLKGTAGTALVNRTTTATLRVTDGWQLIVVRCNGSTGTIQIGSKTPEGFSVSGSPAAAGTPATDDLHIGSVSNTVGNYWHGNLGELVLCNQSLSDVQVALYASASPGRSGGATAKVLAGGEALAPQQLSHCHTHYDFSVAAALFQQLERTGAVANDGDPVGAVEHRGGAALARDATAGANNGTRPAFRPNTKNGLAAVQFDGADDQLNFFSWCKGAALTVFIVAKNNDVAFGSHYLTGTQYVVQTGSGYLGGNNERFVVHPEAGSGLPFLGAEDGVGAPVAGEAWHIYEFTRDADVWESSVDGRAGTTVTNTHIFSMDGMGPLSNPGFWLDGYLGEVVKYNVAHPEANRAKLRAHLAAKWGIALATG